MNPHTISKELAERLHGLGVKTKSYWYWCNILNTETGWNWQLLARGPQGIEAFPAYTSDELGEMLPEEITGDEGMRFDLNIWKTEGWNVAYWWDEDSRRSSGMVNNTEKANTLAEAMGLTLEYLLTHGLLSPEKLN